MDKNLKAKKKKLQKSQVMNRKRRRKHIGKVDQPHLHPETMTKCFDSTRKVIWLLNLFVIWLLWWHQGLWQISILYAFVGIGRFCSLLVGPDMLSGHFRLNFEGAKQAAKCCSDILLVVPIRFREENTYLMNIYLGI